MQTYISMLRGINLGSKQVPMTSLKELYEGLRFKEVITYIQSGNVIFRATGRENSTDLCAGIEKAIHKKYHFEVPVIIRTRAEMKAAIAANPFLHKKGINPEKLHVTFLAEEPGQTQVAHLCAVNHAPDEFVLSGKEIYLHCPNGYGISKLSNNFFENKLKVKATTRNWKTVNKLAELAESVG
ncbi:MAG TPA: DUF1697 domain-containing protein [Puia sp.]|nr:DUF1697 domain-containing protein [Puia sp.]